MAGAHDTAFFKGFGSLSAFWKLVLGPQTEAVMRPPVSYCADAPVFTCFLLRKGTGGLLRNTTVYSHCGNSGTDVFSLGPLPRFKSTLTWKICFRLCSEGMGRHSMLKWRMKRGVTGLRPPPGGAHADTIVTSWAGRNPRKSPSQAGDDSCSYRWQDSNQPFSKDLPRDSITYVFLHHI